MLTATGGISPMFLIGYIIFFCALMYFMAVSYTHLDVYKRQEYIFAEDFDAAEVKLYLAPGAHI